MFEKYTYLLTDLGCVLFPFALSFHPKIRFYKQWRCFLLPCLFTALLFIVWDIAFTAKGVWAFNHAYVCGLYLLGLPVEEYLFFICIPYACVFTYHCIGRLLKPSQGQQVAKLFSGDIILFLTIIALYHLPQLYTSVTFLSLSAFLGFLLLMKVKFLPSFYLSYFIILIPFFISNGILTGSFTAAPVVMYNNTFNLGVRMFTIPVEDTFYGMLLMLLNVSGFEYLKNRPSSL